MNSTAKPDEGSIEKPITKPDWLFAYKMHQENLLYARINIFLITSALFMATFATLLPQKQLWPCLLLCILAVVLTTLWMLNVRRQMYIVSFYSKLCEELDPFYCQAKKRPERQHMKGISGQKSLGYLFPTFFLVVWLLAIAWTLMNCS